MHGTIETGKAALQLRNLRQPSRVVDAVRQLQRNHHRIGIAEQLAHAVEHRTLALLGRQQTFRRGIHADPNDPGARIDADRQRGHADVNELMFVRLEPRQGLNLP